MVPAGLHNFGSFQRHLDHPIGLAFLLDILSDPNIIWLVSMSKDIPCISRVSCSLWKPFQGWWQLPMSTQDELTVIYWSYMITDLGSNICHHPGFINPGLTWVRFVNDSFIHRDNNNHSRGDSDRRLESPVNAHGPTTAVWVTMDPSSPKIQWEEVNKSPNRSLCRHVHPFFGLFKFQVLLKGLPSGKLT